MGPRKALISFLTLLAIIILLNIGPYRLWLDEKVLSFTEDLYDQVDNMDYEYRRIYRFGPPYSMAMQLKTKLKDYDSTLTNIRLLVPPQSYIDRKGVRFIMPEPVVMYAYSNIKSALPSSKDVYKSNYGIKLYGDQLYVLQLDSKAAIDSLLTEYLDTTTIAK